MAAAGGAGSGRVSSLPEKADSPGMNPHSPGRLPVKGALRLQRRVQHGRFFYSRASDCRRCPLRGDCLSPGRVKKAVVASDDHPALLRARRQKERRSEEDVRLYRRHRWRLEGFHEEAKSSWHGLARAVRRGLQNMRLQAFLTAAALAAVLAALLAPSLGFLVATAMRPGALRSRGAAGLNLNPDRNTVLQQPPACGIDHRRPVIEGRSSRAAHRLWYEAPLARPRSLGRRTGPSSYRTRVGRHHARASS